MKHTIQVIYSNGFNIVEMEANDAATAILKVAQDEVLSAKKTFSIVESISAVTARKDNSDKAIKTLTFGLSTGEILKVWLYRYEDKELDPGFTKLYYRARVSSDLQYLGFTNDSGEALDEAHFEQLAKQVYQYINSNRLSY